MPNILNAESSAELDRALEVLRQAVAARDGIEAAIRNVHADRDAATAKNAELLAAIAKTNADHATESAKAMADAALAGKKAVAIKPPPALESMRAHIAANAIDIELAAGVIAALEARRPEADAAVLAAIDAPSAAWQSAAATVRAMLDEQLLDAVRPLMNFMILVKAASEFFGGGAAMAAISIPSLTYDLHLINNGKFFDEAGSAVNLEDVADCEPANALCAEFAVRSQALAHGKAAAARASKAAQAIKAAQDRADAPRKLAEERARAAAVNRQALDERTKAEMERVTQANAARENRSITVPGYY